MHNNFFCMMIKQARTSAPKPAQPTAGRLTGCQTRPPASPASCLKSARNFCTSTTPEARESCRESTYSSASSERFASYLSSNSAKAASERVSPLLLSGHDPSSSATVAVPSIGVRCPRFFPRSTVSCNRRLAGLARQARTCASSGEKSPPPCISVSTCRRHRASSRASAVSSGSACAWTPPKPKAAAKPVASGIGCSSARAASGEGAVRKRTSPWTPSLTSTSQPSESAGKTRSRLSLMILPERLFLAMCIRTASSSGCSMGTRTPLSFVVYTRIFFATRRLYTCTSGPASARAAGGPVPSWTSDFVCPKIPPRKEVLPRCTTLGTRAWLSEKSGLQFCSSRPLIRTMVIGTSAVLATLSSSLLCRREKRFRKESAGRQLHSEIGLTTHVKHPSVHCIARLARCFAWFAIFCFSCKLFSRFAPPGVVAVASSAEVSAASSSSCASVGSSVYCGSLSSNFWMRMYSPSTAFSMGL
mmetsp:Transcript_17868/g.45726  ORF Transcript_17868/g.45726 Transcript_17868/m.45726 type:complete len:474 (-) Transcript_17868:859-2280(-)